MNEALKASRRLGVFIIHCPSDNMDFYRGHPARPLRQRASLLALAEKAVDESVAPRHAPRQGGVVSH